MTWREISGRPWFKAHASACRSAGVDTRALGEDQRGSRYWRLGGAAGIGVIFVESPVEEEEEEEVAAEAVEVEAKVEVAEVEAGSHGGAGGEVDHVVKTEEEDVKTEQEDVKTEEEDKQRRNRTPSWKLREAGPCRLTLSNPS
jgi:hypothetical protein